MESDFSNNLHVSADAIGERGRRGVISDDYRSEKYPYLQALLCSMTNVANDDNAVNILHRNNTLANPNHVGLTGRCVAATPNLFANKAVWSHAGENHFVGGSTTAQRMNKRDNPSGLFVPKLALRKLTDARPPMTKKEADGHMTSVAEAYTGKNNVLMYEGVGALCLGTRAIYHSIGDNLTRSIHCAYQNIQVSVQMMEDTGSKECVDTYLSSALDLQRPAVLSAVHERLIISARRIKYYLESHIATGLAHTLFYTKRAAKYPTAVPPNANAQHVNMVYAFCRDPLNRMLFNLDVIGDVLVNEVEANLCDEISAMAMKLVSVASHATLNTLDFAYIKHGEKIHHANMVRLLFMDELAHVDTRFTDESRRGLDVLKAYLKSSRGVDADVTLKDMLDYLKRDEMARADVLLNNADSLAFYLCDIGRNAWAAQPALTWTARDQ